MDFNQARFNMVEQQVRPCKIFDDNLLRVLGEIPREEFVQKEYQNIAYADLELPLPGVGNMLCPQIAAQLIQALEIKTQDKVLEIGTGSGYVTSVIAKLCNFIYSVEINPLNHAFAVNNLSRLGIKNANLVLADGEFGLESRAPFNKIIINASMPGINEQLKNQLKVAGKIAAIIGNSHIMHLKALSKLSENEYKAVDILETYQEPLIMGIADLAIINFLERI